MLKYLVDVPNAITAIGLFLAIGAMHLTVNSHFDVAIGVVIWAVMLDHLDGWVARRMKNRPREYALVGGDMDSATDMVSAGIVPGLIALQLAHGSTLSLVSSVLIALAACLRLAYFNNFGLTETGRFYGVPMTYTVPITGLFFVIAKFWKSFSVAEVLPWELIVMAALHVSPYGPPPLRGVGLLFVFLYAAVISMILIFL
ncbi:CDP-alcohol phosphatidyltransferase family protein [Paraburkholderia sp. BR14263]|uniref:CDP-alcohol phosphatidyltransferase family protein n=1 Tax=unclassified Paraburkholderia TaxID=2615204 RepID=UPI0034CDBE9F